MGNFQVADNVVADMAYRALCELFGKDPEDKNFKKNRKGISVELMPEEKYVITAKLDLPYKTNVLEFSIAVMKKIKERVSELTGKSVERVSVIIQDVESAEAS